MSDLTTLLASHRAKAEACENSVMLCAGWERAAKEALSPEAVCATCGQRKMPHGRSLPFPRGYQGDCDCEGYDQEPRPSNLFGGEKHEVATHIAANDPATVLALLDVVEAAEAWRRTRRESYDQFGLSGTAKAAADATNVLLAALDRLKEVLR